MPEGRSGAVKKWKNVFPFLRCSTFLYQMLDEFLAVAVEEVNDRDFNQRVATGFLQHGGAG